MNALPSLPVVVPLLGAALLAGVGGRLPRRAGEIGALLVAAFALACDALLLRRSIEAPIVTWFGGWRPRGGVAVGIDFAVDPFGAGFALIAALLVVAACVFALEYFDSYHAQLQALLLAFLAALEGFGLTGDVFDLFVFFELMGACAFVLCAYKSREQGPIQGAINFAVLNTVGAFLVLFGIGLLYARTGALNMAQIGRGLDGRCDALVIAAFAFVAAGFFVKAAMVPFHFWLADAHAVAPTPVCVLFSGVMVEAGLYAVARLYGAVFAPSFALGADRLCVVLASFGALTALVGGAMCFAQRHIKRLLAYSTVSHVGTMLVGLACLDARGVGGAAFYAVGHACVKGALFFAAGILLHRFRSVDEIALRGRGRRLPWLGALVAVGGWALAGGAPFGLCRGDHAIEGAARSRGVEVLVDLASAGAVLTGAAVLRLAIRVFVGWGAAKPAWPGPEGERTEEPETENSGAIPIAMWLPPIVLMLLGLAVGLAPRLAEACQRAAARALDTGDYARWILDDASPAWPTNVGRVDMGVARGVMVGAAAVAIAVAVLGRDAFPRALRPVGRGLRSAIGALRNAHTGRVGDYLAWLAFGVAALGGALAWAGR